MTKPDPRYRTYGFTDPDVAKRYREARWSGKGSREAYLNSIRYHGKFELPKERK